MKCIVCLVCLLSLCAFSESKRFRVVWQDNPESEACVIWDQSNGSNPRLYYDKLDHGQNTGKYAFSSTPDKELDFRGMDNTYVYLKNLQPDTLYYFVVKDSNDTSERYFFRTAPATKKPFRFIQGGDSRNNRDVRQDGNRLVAKIRPLFVSFGGDMTSSGTSTQWKDWFSDWELSISDDGRITPIVPIRGNHEDSSEIPNLFGLHNRDAYYKITISDNLFCQYLLNSEINTEGSQKSWLESDLEANRGNVTFLSASYHKPMRPHVSSKSEGDDVYDAWADIFYDYRFDLLAENDSHCVKRTKRVKPSNSSGSDEGFIQAADGFVMIGEGCWGAPLRSGSDTKDWTLDSGSFNSFDMVDVHLNKIEIRTIDFSNESSVDALTSLDDTFEIPRNLKVWQASGGAVQTIEARDRGNEAPPTSNTIVFDKGSEWIYYDEQNGPAADWKEMSFDDSSWLRGDAELGFGDGDESTVLDFGGDSSNKTATYYFRKNFSLKSVDASTTLTMNLTYDDGCVIYVNGQEVKRVNMPSGAISHSTFAASTVGNNAETSLAIDSDFLNPGTNTIAVEVHNRSLTSSDISFDAKLSSNQDNVGVPDSGVSNQVFGYNSSWNFYDKASAPNSNWKNTNYDDSTWDSGDAELGFGDGDESTVLDYGGDSKNKTISYYFRKDFFLNSVDEQSKLTLDLIYDDGCVIYVNGQEVERVNMPSGTITHTTFAASTVNNNASTSVTVNSSFLLVGKNTIAIEVHNRSLTSSDISLNAKLSSNQFNTGEPKPPTETTVFDYDSQWIYYDKVEAPGNGWHQLSFDDSQWQNGNAELGFGDGDENTVLDFGGDSRNKTATYYFRKYFALTSVDSSSFLTLNLIYDDGCVIYVNGQEVERVNMPSGTITHTTFAASTVNNNASTSAIIPASFLESGINIIAIEMHNRSKGSSDISLNAQLISNQDNIGVLQDELFTNESKWSYYDDLVAPPGNWSSLSFDDSDWSEGNGQLGFGDGDENTVLDFGGDSSNKTAAYYFRRNFTLWDVEQVDSCSLDITFDDGCIIYINGQEVKRINMPTGDVSHTTFASGSSGDNALSRITVPLSTLKEGVNSIAVEVHNRSKRSSDISFDASLSITK